MLQAITLGIVEFKVLQSITSYYAWHYAIYDIIVLQSYATLGIMQFTARYYILVGEAQSAGHLGITKTWRSWPS